MRYVAAYMLAAMSGKDPTSNDIEKILSSVGIESDNEKLERVLKELKGKNVEELTNKGREKLSSVPMGGGVAVAGGGAAATASAAAPAEEKKEEKKVEKEDSESDDDMGFGLFD